MSGPRRGHPAVQAVRALRSRELVGVTFGWSADSIVRGLAAGRFPIPRSNGSPLTPWYAPRHRAVLRAEQVHLGQTLRRRLRSKGWVTSVDVAFDDVLERCADRPRTWLTPAFQETLRELHRRGIAHSLEVWNPAGKLVGGTFGTQTGGLMTADSLFHSEDHAAKVALVDLASRVRAGGGVAIDCQYLRPHTEALGATTIDRAAFQRLLFRARAIRVVLPSDRRSAARLIDPGSPDALDLPGGGRGAQPPGLDR